MVTIVNKVSGSQSPVVLSMAGRPDLAIYLQCYIGTNSADLHTPSELNAPAHTLCNAPHSDMYLTDLQPQWAGTQGVCNTVAALYVTLRSSVPERLAGRFQSSKCNFLAGIRYPLHDEPIVSMMSPNFAMANIGHRRWLEHHL